MLVANPLRDLDRPFDDVVRWQRQLATAGLRCNLNLAGSFQIVHKVKRLRNASTVCEGAVVTKEHHSLIAKIGNKFLLFLRSKHRAIVIVVSDLSEKVMPN